MAFSHFSHVGSTSGRLAAPASAPRLLVALLAQGVAPAEGHQLLEDEANGLAIQDGILPIKMVHL